MIKKNLYIGWDIGGAHTKYTISFKSKDIVECRIIHCELWKSLSKLDGIIQNVNSKYKEKFNIINLITMSAEMCDIFPSRAKGVKSILSLFEKRDFNNHVYSKDNKILNLEGFKKYSSCESTNWMVIAEYLKNIEKNMVAIDIGSTTTDLVLVKDHVCINTRYDDYSGLNTKELLYTGVLRTPIYSVTNCII
jgi:probable H4MPT-linked C1 transfer pathway protein